MKAFKTLVLAGCVAAGFAASAQAADLDQSAVATGLYLRADAGWSFLDWTGGTLSNDNAPTIGGGVGYRFSDYLRADLRGDWAGNYTVAPGSDMSISSVLGNAYLDWPTGTAFTPYVGVGAGYGWANIKGLPDKDGFTGALMAGVAVDVTQNLAIDVGYRLRDVMVKGADPIEHQVMAGLRFSF
jgi:opacity protein-like surface antigen